MNASIQENISAPKFKIGQEVLRPDGKISKVLDVIFNSASGWTYKVFDKFVDVVKIEVVKGFILLREDQLKEVPVKD